MAMDLNRLNAQLQDEMNQAMAGFKAKGAEHFKKPLAVAAALAAVGFLVLYRVPAKQLTTVRSQVYKMREITSYAEEYRDLKARLAGLVVKFPAEAQKKDWLFNLVLKTAADSGIKIDAISTQKETSKPELPFMVLAIDVSATGSYHQVGRWLAKLENAGYFTHIEDFMMMRESGSEGGATDVRTVKVSISTAIPRGMAAL